MDLKIIIIIMLVIVLILIFVSNFSFNGFNNKNKFISKQTYDLYNNSKKAFDISNSYTNFKKYVKKTDPVQFMDLYGLYRQSKLSPENIQSLQ